MPLNRAVTFPSFDPLLVARLRDDLAAAEFTVESLGSLWGAAAEAALRRGQHVPAQRKLERRRHDLGGPDPLAALATLFVLGRRISPEELTTALPRLRADGAVRLGLVQVDAHPIPTAIPLVHLRPYGFVDSSGVGSWWIVSDLGELAVGGVLREDHVLGVGGASSTLSGLMIAEPAARVLDLGTGGGIQALHAARHAGVVVATDISARALRIASFNAALNGVRNVEFREGSLYDPVAGERFDQIVSNPPFVITPRGGGVPSYEYRDGGLVGDEIVASVVRGAAQHLVVGGVAQLLGNWEYRTGSDAFDRISEWAWGKNLNVWVVEREVQDVESYAETWIRDGGTKPGSAEFDGLYEAWLDDFEARSVVKVGFGYLTLRRRRAAGTGALRRFERLDGPLGGQGARLGEHLAATLRAQDWLLDHDDPEFAVSVLTVAGDVTEERHYWPGEEHPTVMDLRQGGGFGRTVSLDTALAAVVGACDGELSLGAICSAVAGLLDVAETDLLRDVLPKIRELVLTGFLNF